MSSPRTIRETLRILAAITGSFCAGCATVDPHPDYQRASDLIVERTGSADVYDPATQEMIEQKLDALLLDGLTVDEAVRAALLNNHGLQALFADIGASRADVVQSGLLTNPSFSIMTQFIESGGRPKIGIDVAQQLVDLWQIPVRKKVAEEQLTQTVLAAAQRAVELMTDVKKQCYEVLWLQRFDEIVTENLSIVEQMVTLLTQQLAVGEASQLDVNLVRADLQDVHLDWLKVQRDRQVADAALGRLMGLSRTPGRWALRDALPPVGPLPDDASLIVLAMSQRFEGLSAIARVQEAEATVQHEMLKVFPNVTAGLTFERTERKAMPGRDILADTARASIAQGQLAAPDIESRARRDQARRQIIDAMLGPAFEITLPIWDQNQAQIAKARFVADQRRREFEDVLDVIAADVQQAAARARIAEAQVRYYEDEALPLVRQNLATARLTFVAGEASILVLLDAERSLLMRRRAYLDVLRDYAVAMAQLERALGGRLTGTTTQPAVTQPANS